MDVDAAWCLFFASVTSFQYHPRNEGEVDLQKCADVADAMLVIYLDRRAQWPGERR